MDTKKLLLRFKQLQRVRKVIRADNFLVLKGLSAESVNLIYIDPPFNTGRSQSRGELGYKDKFEDYIGFLEPLLEHSKRILSSNGSIFVHVDFREVHYVKVLLDQIFSREAFINEIIWAYDYGARQKKKWATKHDNILWYAKDPQDYIFNAEKVDEIPYKFSPLKDFKGERTPSDVWWHTIVHTTGKEKTGYPTQKPLGILERIVCMHSKENDIVLDFFAGSGSIGEACAKHNRQFILIDKNEGAFEIMKMRLGKYNCVFDGETLS